LRPVKGSAHAAPGFSRGYRTYVLSVLTVIYSLSGFDRSVLWIMLEPIKAEFHLTDTQLGWLSGFAFAAVYAVVGIPLGVIADRTVRTRMIAVATGLWSVATLLCATAGSFWSLFAARMVVGAAESAAPPASIALLADLYPARDRATATSVYMSASAISLVAAFALGGWLAAGFGWRMGFLLAGAPGMLVAALALLTFREPSRATAEVAPGRGLSQGLRETGARLKRNSAAKWILLALTLCSVATVGISAFLTSLLVRVHHLDVRSAGLSAAAGFLLAVGGVPLLGRLSDRLGEHHFRWRRQFPGIVCCFAALGGELLALPAHSAPLMLALPLLATASAAQVALAFSLMQEVIAPGMRATTLAIAYGSQNLVGGGLGPVLMGMLSDTFVGRHAQDSLRYATAVISLFFVGGGACYALAARHHRGADGV
jgi:MFS family permease